MEENEMKGKESTSVDASVVHPNGLHAKIAPQYTTLGGCIVSPDGKKHAPFGPVGSDVAKIHCDELNAGRADVFGWVDADKCHRHEKPEPEPSHDHAITITHDHVFRDQDWGLGMFDADNPHVVVDEDRIWLMIGTDPVEFGKDKPFLGATEARSIAAMLVAAADFLEGQE